MFYPQVRDELSEWKDVPLDTPIWVEGRIDLDANLMFGKVLAPSKCNDWHVGIKRHDGIFMPCDYTVTPIKLSPRHLVLEEEEN